jgi:hypothetical protein
VLSHLLRAELPAGPQPGLDALAQPGQLLLTLALTGYYPVLPWTTYLLAGMAIGRLDLRRAPAAIGLLVGGSTVAAAAAIGSAWLLGPGGGAAILGVDALARRNYGTTPNDSWWWLSIMAPHSGTPFDLAHTTGTALAVLGAMLLLARLAPAVARAPAAVGAIPLTLYTLHVLLLSGYAGQNQPEQVLVGLWAAHVLGAVVLGVAVQLLGRRGPLEAVVSLAGRTVRRAVDPRSGRVAGGPTDSSRDPRSTASGHAGAGAAVVTDDLTEPVPTSGRAGPVRGGLVTGGALAGRHAAAAGGAEPAGSPRGPAEGGGPDPPTDPFPAVPVHPSGAGRRTDT